MQIFTVSGSDCIIVTLTIPGNDYNIIIPNNDFNIIITIPGNDYIVTITILGDNDFDITIGYQVMVTLLYPEYIKVLYILLIIV